MNNLPRDTDGKLSAWAWPGGYPIYYLDKCNNVLCPDCANRDIDASQAPIAADVNWEDSSLHCDDCSKRIESAYAEENIYPNSEAAHEEHLALDLPDV